MARVDVDRLPDLVVVDVAGHGKAPDQVYGLVLLLAGVSVSTAGRRIGGIHVSAAPEHVSTRVVPQLIGPGHGPHPEHPLVPRRVGGEQLERGTGGVLTLDGPVEHGEIVGRVVELGPPVEAKAADRLIGVVRREGGHSHYVTHPRVQYDDRAARGVVRGQELAGSVRIGVRLPGAGQVD